MVFCANAFALLGLRALFFVVSGLLERLVFLSLGLSIILAFIGVKLILEFVHGQVHGVPEISTATSLVVIVIVLGATTVASLLRTRARGPDRRPPGDRSPGSTTHGCESLVQCG